MDPIANLAVQTAELSLDPIASPNRLLSKNSNNANLAIQTADVGLDNTPLNTQIPTMDTSDLSLSTLRLHLPDPGVVLYCRALTEFSLFPELPVELRLRIWVLSIKARKVTVNADLNHNNTIFNTHGPITLSSRHPSPACLRICQESRQFTLIYYIKLLEGNQSYNRCSAHCRSTRRRGVTYFNPQMDTLNLPTLNCMTARPRLSLNSQRLQHALSRVQYLELHHFTWDDWGTPSQTAYNAQGQLQYSVFNVHAPLQSSLEDFVGQPFGELKRLRLVCDDLKFGGWARSWYLGDENGRKECVDALKEYYEKMASEIPGFSVPEIALALPKLNFRYLGARGANT
ncbi:hypothetical protein BDZ45DRAFT_811044 [Acephala macrosclerotiorum]|nr:hypothetical protein BDZ45DRAFT_811044 [Acephala macrosclerotiorum]